MVIKNNKQKIFLEFQNDRWNFYKVLLTYQLFRVKKVQIYKVQ